MEQRETSGVEKRAGGGNPPSLAPISLDVVRAEVLRRTFVAVAIVGSAFLAAWLPLRAPPRFDASSVCVTMLVALAALFTRVSALTLETRALLWLGWLVITAEVVLLHSGFVLPGAFQLNAAAVVLAGLLVGRRATWIFFAVTIVGIGVAGLVICARWLGELRVDDAAVLQPKNWVRVTLGYTGLTAMIGIAVHSLLRRSERALTTAHEALDRLKEEQAKREATQAALEEARRMEAMGRLAAGVAHDFNNVLSVVNGWASILDAELSPADRRDAAAQIRSAAENGALLTRQLAAFARREVLLPAGAVELDASVRSALPSVKRLMPPQVTVMTELGAPALHVGIDDSQLTRVLFNMAVNARDAMPSGGTLAVATRHRHGAPPGAQLAPATPAPHGYVELEVRDTGGGISPEVLPHIFEPFFTTKAPGRGTGLGLASVLGIVGQLDGYLTVESAVGAGTTFRIGLPVAESPSPPPAVEPARAEAARATPAEVLVIEDDAINRRLVTLILERAGYVVHGAADGEAALHLVDGGARPDLVCTDGMLPGLPTNLLIDRLSARLPAARFLVVSGMLQDDLALRQVRTGALPFLAKPFRAEDLVERVRDLIGPARGSA